MRLFLEFIIQTHQTSALKQKSCSAHSGSAPLPVKGTVVPHGLCSDTELPDIGWPEDTEQWGWGGECYPVQRGFKTFGVFFPSSSWGHLQVRGLSPALLGFLLHTSEQSPLEGQALFRALRPRLGPARLIQGRQEKWRSKEQCQPSYKERQLPQGGDIHTAWAGEGWADGGGGGAQLGTPRCQAAALPSAARCHEQERKH